MIFKKIGIVCLCIFLSLVQAGYVQEPAVQAPQPNTDKKITALQKEINILRQEIRNVRESVSSLKKETKSIDDVSQAVAELNAKLEAQMTTMNSLSGEIYRIASVQENNLPKGARNKENLDSLDQAIQDNKLSIKDIEDELKVLRAVQSDLQNQSNKESAAKDEPSKLRNICNWKYWGQTACGIALAALIIAL
ncbi:MAG: hypothetical protein ABII23_05280 [bacterium]